MFGKSVYDVPGIGPKYGPKLIDMGYSTAVGLHTGFLNSGAVPFKGWLINTVGMQPYWAGKCCTAFETWQNNSPNIAIFTNEVASITNQMASMNIAPPVLVPVPQP